MPAAFEALDLSEYDLVLSSSSSCSKGVITRRTRCTSATATPPPATCGISTIPTATTPTGWFAGVMPHQIHKLRVWDKCARRPGGLLHRQLPLHRPAHQEVLPPGCGCDLPLRPYQRGTPGPQGGLLPVVGRFTWYKRMDLAVAACPGWANPWWSSAPAGRSPNSRPWPAPPSGFWAAASRTRRSGATTCGQRPSLFPGEEDFGITPVEAQSAGTPVLAFGRGGALRERGGRADRPLLPRADGGLGGRLHPPVRGGGRGLQCRADSATTAAASRRRGLSAS